MAFLAAPCRCGWALDDNEDGTVRSCIRCNRRWELKSPDFWEQVTPRDKIRQVHACRHNRLVGDQCPHCPSQVAARSA